MAEKELQEKVVAYRLLESRLEGLIKQRQVVASKLIEIETTSNSIDEIEKSEDVLFPIGAEAYAFGKVMDKKKMIVEIGANVAIEKTVEGAKEVMNERKKDITAALEDIQKDIDKTSSMLEQLATDIQTYSGETEAEAG